MARLDLNMLLSLLNAAECEVCIMQHLILGSELHQYPSTRWKRWRILQGVLCHLHGSHRLSARRSRGLNCKYVKVHTCVHVYETCVCHRKLAGYNAVCYVRSCVYGCWLLIVDNLGMSSWQHMLTIADERGERGGAAKSWQLLTKEDWSWISWNPF